MQQPVQRLLAVVAFRAHERRHVRRAVAQDAQRKFLFHLFGHEPGRGLDVHLLVGRTGHQHFDEGIALAVALDFQRLADRLPGLLELGHVRERHARDVDRRLQLADQFRHVQRVARLQRIAPVRRGFRLLAHERGRGHLPAGHAVDRVVDEEHRQLLAAVRRLHRLVEADGRQIAVALVGHHHGLVFRARDARAHGRGAAVRDLHVARVEIVVGEHRAAHGADHDRPVLQLHVRERLADELVQHAVLAAGAIVRRRQRRTALARKYLVEAPGFDHFFHRALPPQAFCAVARIFARISSRVTRLPPSR